ncbi:MAG: insulinase family protein [Gammaproteobacteria bacterium]|nr:insulinase family protein [Gammaproteobacteria bacterium]
MEDLDAASLDDVRSFFSTWYAPNNAVLTVVGDIDEEEMIAAVERHFGAIPANPALPAHPDLALSAPLGGEIRKTIHDKVPEALTRDTTSPRPTASVEYFGAASPRAINRHPISSSTSAATTQTILFRSKEGNVMAGIRRSVKTQV